MNRVNSTDIEEKIVLLRFDIDVTIENGEVTEDFRLRAGLPTLNLCLQSAEKVILIGHIGRPEGKIVPSLCVAPILKWFENHGFKDYLINGQLVILENLRFDSRESFGSAADKESVEYAKELAQMGDIYINEAFAAYHPAASTTVLPTLLPHFAGLNFAKEVEVLTRVKQNPSKPLVVIMGGAKVEDKLPVINEMAKIADAVLVGGKLIKELMDDPVAPVSRRPSSLSLRARLQDPSSAPPITLALNVYLGNLTDDGFDVTSATIKEWEIIISKAKMIVWNGPVGKIEVGNLKVENLETAKGTYDLAKIILNSGAEIIIGGGDTVSFLDKVGLLDQFQSKSSVFISTGGGAMLKLLSDGTLPTIEVLI